MNETTLLIIGGGATGLGIAWDAALRGIDTVLIEQGDLAHGTSGRYHGLLHSGGRYVISDPHSAADCARENTILRNIVPHLIEDTGGLFVYAPSPSPPEDESWPDRWLAGCKQTGVPAEEISPSKAIQTEPLLNPAMTRAFRVQDASLDSFDLLHTLAFSVRAAGGKILLRHRLTRLLRENDGQNEGRIIGAEVENRTNGETLHIHAALTVNATGPWAGMVARTAGIEIPVVPGKGTMLAMAKRMVHTVINRCTPPTHGDIIVPVGTVAVLGTTDTPVEDPAETSPAEWEIELLLREAETLIPAIRQFRPLRVWAGSRPLYRPSGAAGHEKLPRAHAVFDHAGRDGTPGLLTMIGGKLTTFRLMAEEAVDKAAEILGVTAPCKTAETPLSDPGNKHYHTLAHRLKKLEQPAQNSPALDPIICECELVPRSQLEAALETDRTFVLDDLRRETRLGMGPCQAGFCALRAAGLLAEKCNPPDNARPLLDFIQERWKGVYPVAWGHNLRQAELHRMIYLELLGVGEY